MGTKILSAEGHEVTTVSNGQAALKTLKDFIPDLIVADVFMPGKTGYEVCQFIKSDPKLSRIPVVLIVAPMEPYDSTEGHRVKADSLVTKPLESSNLVAIVEQLLAAAKKSAPPPAAESKPAPAPAGVNDSGAQSGVFADDIATRVTPVELEIPEEMRQQPVSMVGDLLEPQAAPAAAEEVAGLAAELLPIDVGPVVATPGEQPAASPAPSSWMAASAAVTEDDKKLFEPPPPDWQGLVSMVQEADEPPQPPAAMAAGMGRMASQSPDAESETAAPAAPVAPRESESPKAHLRSEGTSNSEPVEDLVSSPSLQEKSVSPTDSVELPAPAIAPLDYSTVEQIVRETVEELMPEIVDRISKATGISFAKKG
jgi:CheY-like chemotaxis protein